MGQSLLVYIEKLRMVDQGRICHSTMPFYFIFYTYSYTILEPSSAFETYFLHLHTWTCYSSFIYIDLLAGSLNFRFNNYFGIDCKIGQNVVFNNLKSFKCGIIGNGDSRSSSRICSSVNYHQYGLRDANQFIISRTNGEILHFLID
ncbi:uncharacterized protein LOC107829457 isoform X1 [Nicotiana tabacum]|uniref:Uncharacterized protein LOC107829457 isoform X1 n=1 Tax=Nicotiana tabacum TaxID=4097 RepID=A0AC58S3A7_TOBAC